MSFLDIILGLLLLYGLWKGLKNGLFVELASIVALIAGIYGAIHFSYYAGDYLSQNMDWNERYINIAAFVITFIVIVLAVQLAGKFLTKIANFAMLGLLNKVAGGIFGVVKVAVILGALLIFFERVNNSAGVVKDETMQESVLYGPIKEIGAFVFSKVLKEDSPIEPKEETEEIESVVI
ncbi:CvpA family protein [Zobellia galactanivorans]|uniref:CvpA family protein n=1 Tax=Zobellia galactanivorans (strain DSM 12802 / CCUG 47099 / CIP 106680 / NCIMB 13871 / Dsij) TaxID=63186 RepID=G0LAS7_ZOBGA|nr:CvpA family protein [Zobellia galactanivorans]MDO6808286.1 CvpA family protein [Zobellia galactanivorans]CAZ95528.1 CvpA family protein [Zobellia galactanivorans]